MRVIYGKRVQESVGYGDVVTTDRGNEYLVVRSPFGGITKAKNEVLLVDLKSSVVIDEFETLDDLSLGKFHDNFGKVTSVIPKSRLALMVDGDSPEKEEKNKPVYPKTSDTTPRGWSKQPGDKELEARF